MSRSARNRPTVRDVARQAGVSVATVSRAFSKPADVNAQTREKVLRLAHAMGYHHNRLAIDFRRGITRSIVVLVADITNPFFSEFLKGVEESAHERGYLVLIGDVAGDEENARSYVEMVASGKADGIVLNTATFPQALVPVQDIPDVAPFVTCNEVDWGRPPLVTMDFETGGHAAGTHLATLGHSRIAQIMGPPDQTAIALRHAGFLRALREAGVQIDETLYRAGKLGMAHGMEAARALMACPQPPTAIFAHNDETALGAMHALSEMGLTVPQDVSIVGYDDLSFSRALSPALTTVAIPRREWGRRAAAMLLARLHGETGVQDEEILHTRLIVRDSTTAAPKAQP